MGDSVDGWESSKAYYSFFLSLFCDWEKKISGDSLSLFTWFLTFFTLVIHFQWHFHFIGRTKKKNKIIWQRRNRVGFSWHLVYVVRVKFYYRGCWKIQLEIPNFIRNYFIIIFPFVIWDHRQKPFDGNEVLFTYTSMRCLRQYCIRKVEMLTWKEKRKTGY